MLWEKLDLYTKKYQELEVNFEVVCLFEGWSFIYIFENVPNVKDLLCSEDLRNSCSGFCRTLLISITRDDKALRS